MNLIRRFNSWMDRLHSVPRIRNYMCVVCGSEARHLETSTRPYCKCGNRMVLLDD